MYSLEQCLSHDCLRFQGTGLSYQSGPLKDYVPSSKTYGKLVSAGQLCNKGWMIMNSEAARIMFNPGFYDYRMLHGQIRNGLQVQLLCSLTPQIHKASCNSYRHNFESTYNPNPHVSI